MQTWTVFLPCACHQFQYNVILVYDAISTSWVRQDWRRVHQRDGIEISAASASLLKSAGLLFEPFQIRIVHPCNLDPIEQVPWCYGTAPPSELAQVVTISTCNRKVPSSNFSSNTRLSTEFSWFYAVPSDKHWTGIWNKATTAPFQVIY
jgi:hypothetical protein